jgi:peroxiredoxin
MVFFARILLAAVFGVSALGKLRDGEGVGRAVAEFGVPSRFAAALGTLLTLVELGVALALVFRRSAQAGAVGALLLLVGLSGAVAWNVGRGRHPDCHCFGRLSSGRVGWSTVARNGFYATFAGFVALDGHLGRVLVGSAVVTMVLWLGPGVRRRWVQRAGALAPAFTLSDEAGDTWTLEALLEPRRPLVLVFSQPGCQGCDALLPDIARWQAELKGRVTLTVVSGGSQADASGKAREHGLRRLLVDDRQRVFRSYGVSATPSAVLIDAGRSVITSPALGAGEIERLVDGALEQSKEPRLTRRRVLGQTAAGFGSIALGPLLAAVAAACGSSGRKGAATSTTAAKGKEVNVGGAWLCSQPYALCTTAACQPSPSDPNLAVCHCFVLTGHSIGFLPCAQRAPSADKLVSTFSTQNVNRNFGAMTVRQTLPGQIAST